jgi:hypothetical protein
MAETPLGIAFEHAQKNVDGQRLALDNLRSRAATLLSAAALVTSFLGAEALKDQKVGADGTLVADRTLQSAEYAAIACFLVVVVACLFILMPKRKGWTFRLDPATLIVGYVDGGATLVQTQRALAGHLKNHFADNARKLETRYWAFQAGAAFLGAEVACWLIDLT